MRRLFIVMMIVALSIGLIGNVAAASTAVPTFKVNGRLFVTPAGEPAPYFNKDYRTMASLRLIGEAIGIPSKDITWDKETQTASLTRGKHRVAVTLGKKEMKVNGKTVVMDTVAEQKQGRIFIPVKFIAEGLGIGLEFDAATNTVHFITDKNAVVNNNFEEYGLTVLNPLPLTLEVNGLAITYEEAFLYERDSVEAKAINDKYFLTRLTFDKPSHILWLKVKITNNSEKTINSNHLDIEPKMGAKIGGRMAIEVSANQSEWIGNGGDYLHYWSVDSGKSISGYVALAKVNEEEIEYISLSTIHRDRLHTERIATKE